MNSDCPYPACGVSTPLIQQAGVCPCEWKLPTAVCSVCRQSNRIHARFCRACGSDLPKAKGFDADKNRSCKVNFSGIEDAFRRPPVTGNGLVYALSKGGAVYQISSRAGGKVRRIAQLDSPSAGFNTYRLVNVAPGNGAIRGWTLLAAGVSAIESLSLADCKPGKLYEARLPETIAVNRSEADSTGFRGLAANDTICAFVLETAPGQKTLAIQHLGQDSPVERPLTLDGSSVAGPLLCGSKVLFATEAQIGVYDLETRQGAALDFPAGFLPLLSQTAGDLTVAPGGMPLVLMAAEPRETLVGVAGSMQGRAGLLQIQVERNEAKFRPTPKGSSLSTYPDGAACLRGDAALEIFTASGSRSVPVRTEPGMPAFAASPYLISFGQVDFAGEHRVHVVRRGATAEARFEDPLCNKDSCCAAYVVGEDTIVAYLNIFASLDAQGLRFALWSSRESV